MVAASTRTSGVLTRTSGRPRPRTAGGVTRTSADGTRTRAAGPASTAGGVTGGRVMVDGRNDMYSEQILNDYVSIRNATEDWEELADRYGVEAMILPPEAAVVTQAPQSGDWCEAYRDEVAVLLLRSCASQT